MHINLALILISTFTAATPVALAAIGGTLTAQVDVFNVGLEGMMLTGAFFGFVVSDQTGNVVAGLLAGGSAGTIMALVLAVAVLSLGADEVVAGLGVNLGALGLTSVFLTAIYHQQGSAQSTHAGLLTHLSTGPVEIPLVSQVVRGTDWMTVVALVVVAAAMIVTYHTTFGLRLRAVGSSPETAEASGVQATRYRYIAFAISGLLSGVAGAYLPLSGLSLFTDNMTSGIGYIALAAVLFGNGRPGRAAIGAYLYGITFAVGTDLQEAGIAAELVQMLPWIATIVALALAVRQGRPRTRKRKPNPPNPGHTSPEQSYAHTI